MFRKPILCLVLLTIVLLGFGCGCPQASDEIADMPLYPYGKPSEGCPQGNGKIEYQTVMTGDFSGKLQLSGLGENHEYVFTINGWPGRPGDSELKKACAESQSSITGYCDIIVGTDANGNVNDTIERSLPAGRYDIKFLVKDPSQDYCVLLFNDNPKPFNIR
jgi:hypothetical protein